MSDEGDDVMADEGDNHTRKLSCRLFDAIRDNNIEQVRICVSQGVDLTLDHKFNLEEDNCAFDFNICPFANACRLGHEEIMTELLKAGANPNHISGTHFYPVMHMAAEEGVITLSMIRSLISYGADVNLRDVNEQTILHILARYKCNDTDDNLVAAVKLLLDNGASLYAQDMSRKTPLYYGCRYGNFVLVKFCIAEGADVNFGTEHVTMLRGAAEGCNIDMFNLLLDVGANRHLTPDVLIDPCSRNDHAMIARILDTCDVDINIALNEVGLCRGMTILHHACNTSGISSGTVQLLLERGADARGVCADGDTALHFAVQFGGDCIKIRHLLSYNPHLNIKNNENQTPLVKLIRFPIGAYNRTRNRTNVLAFKMIVTAGAQVTADFEDNRNQLCIKHTEAQISDYEITSTISLREMCRLVIRGSIPVPVDASLCKLPIPKLLQEYLNFPEFDSLVDEYLNIIAGNGRFQF